MLQCWLQRITYLAKCLIVQIMVCTLPSAGQLVRAVAGCSVAEPLNGKIVSASQQRKRARATSLFGELPPGPRTTCTFRW